MDRPAPEAAAEAPLPSTASHWERLGFVDDPYHVAPLPVSSAAEQLFVGRAADRERLRQYLANIPTGKTMVEGLPGVGKTSLVNVVQQELFAARQRFPLYEIVEVAPGATREAFLLWVLSAVVSTLRQVFGDPEMTAEAEFRAARDAVTQVLAAGFAGSVSLALGPLGGASVGQTERSSAPLAVTVPTLVDLMRGLLDVIGRRGFPGLVVPVNNLDQLGNAEAIRYLNTVRDTTAAVEGVHWVFIGGDRLFETLETEARRVSESFSSNPIAIEPLGWDEVVEALERRRRAFARQPANPLPISLDVARLVYEAARGELRFVFARLSRTVLDFSIQFPSERTVPDAIAVRLLAEWGRGQLGRVRLTTREQDIMTYIRTHGSVRSSEHAAAGFRTPQQLSNLLRALEAKGMLSAVDEGRTRRYVLTPPALLAEMAQ